MQKFLSVITLLLLNLTTFGQNITIDEKVTVKAGRMASVTIKSDGKSTNWIILPAEGVDIFREYDPDQSVIKLRLLSYSNGTFYIVANTTLNDKIATKTCTIMVGDAGPPIPPPIDNDAQLIRNLKAVYAADPSTNKESELEALIALYDQGAIFAKNVKTYGQVWVAFSEVAKTLGCSQKLIAVQQLIRNEMQIIGIPISPADGSLPIDKEKLIPQLKRISNLLKSIK